MGVTCVPLGRQACLTLGPPPSIAASLGAPCETKKRLEYINDYLADLKSNWSVNRSNARHPLVFRGL